MLIVVQKFSMALIHFCAFKNNVEQINILRVGILDIFLLDLKNKPNKRIEIKF